MIPVLAATTYDPEGRFVPLLAQWMPTVRKRFPTIVVTTPPGLHRETRQLLTGEGIQICEISQNAIGRNYREAITRAAEVGDVLYVDLDRILHWVATYPDELDRTVAACAPHDWVVLERSARAFLTHQRPLRDTEHVFTTVLDSLCGWGPHDFLSGALYLSRDVARVLARNLHAEDQGWWGEYILTLKHEGHAPVFFSCEGLEWETPDRYQREIERAGGLVAWKTSIDTSVTEWESRVNWLEAYIRGARAAHHRYTRV